MTNFDTTAQFEAGTVDERTYRVKGTEEYRKAGPEDVVYNGEIIGSDPDQNVRDEMLRSAGGFD